MGKTKTESNDYLEEVAKKDTDKVVDDSSEKEVTAETSEPVEKVFNANFFTTAADFVAYDDTEGLTNGQAAYLNKHFNKSRKYISPFKEVKSITESDIKKEALGIRLEVTCYMILVVLLAFATSLISFRYSTNDIYIAALYGILALMFSYKALRAVTKLSFACFKPKATVFIAFFVTLMSIVFLSGSIVGMTSMGTVKHFITRQSLLKDEVTIVSANRLANGSYDILISQDEDVMNVINSKRNSIYVVCGDFEENYFSQSSNGTIVLYINEGCVNKQ